MSLAVLLIGLSGGIGLALASFYSLAQTVTLEGPARLAHALTLALTLAVMAALWTEVVPAARIIAAPLLVSAIWAFSFERRWFRVFPLLQQLFAVVLLAGWVAL